MRFPKEPFMTKSTTGVPVISRFEWIEKYEIKSFFFSKTNSEQLKKHSSEGLIYALIMNTV
jgi:hypothetical protein